MKTKKLIILFLLAPLLSFAQESGIKFEHGLSWNQIKEKAKKENKHIFVDCFTTWCGPCKYMANTIFPQPKVGDFFNSNFINAKIQMDQTKDDSEDIKAWYAEASRFEKAYNVRAYPTFLIFDPNGTLVHRIVGGGEADQFIAKAKEGLDPSTQYHTLLSKFEAKPDDVQIARKLAVAAENAYDQETLKRAQATIINSLSEQELFQKENADMLLKSATNSDSKSYQLIKNNIGKIDAVLGQGSANNALSVVLMQELVLPLVKKDENINLDDVQQQLAKSHPEVDMTGMFVRFKPQFYFSKKDWPAFKDAVNAYINTSKVDANQLNSFAWTIFENCEDKACIESALAWSKKSLEEGDENAAYLDTYANLLYKKGNKDEAITTQEKAIAAADDDNKAELQVNLDKMRNGQPTW
ncbi:thiol:disulfide interchange protein precursor [Sphingobacterium spiritivorum]|uniref:Thiol:disulfide interchange protein n=1 Tax=Sphingobacterium spiritivorum TaxID=258 RepID=A0A380BWC7_SPHSI|nr:thioredoxin family protein [Sphingobacterium spiritivorum]SUJ08464.1 thiol:disulfide interchange protein precursor [Sphingobacterium spiritivorum]